MNSIGPVSRFLAVAAMALIVVLPKAQAASIFIDSANLENNSGGPSFVAFNFGQFEGGFSINGSTPIATGGSVFGDGTQLNFTGQWIDLGAAVPFARTVYWVNFKFPTIISEIMQWSITPSGPSGLATISGFFQSKGLGTLPPGVNPADIIIETKNGSHDPFNFSAAFLGGQVITGAVVPEPVTALLIGTGLLGFAASRSRRRQEAA